MEKAYRLPFNHESIQSQSTFDLERAFWESYYREHPAEARLNDRGELETGDAYADALERRIAAGEEPDQEELLAGLPPLVRRRYALEREIWKRTGKSAHRLGFITSAQMEEALASMPTRGPLAHGDKVGPLPAERAAEAAAAAWPPAADHHAIDDDALLAGAPPPNPDVLRSWQDAVKRARDDV